MLNLLRKVADIANSQGMWPTKEWIDWAQGEVSNTPDASVLVANEYHPVFFYDRFMHCHDQWDVSKFEAYAFTKEDYAMWKKKLGMQSFPIALKSRRGDYKNEGVGFGTLTNLAVPAKIKGELHCVDTDTLFSLDKHMHNGVSFRRQKVKLLVPYKEIVWLRDRNTDEQVWRTPLPSSHAMIKHVLEVEAWMYIGKRSWWDDLLDAGYIFAPVSIFPKDGELYSFFSVKELDVEVNPKQKSVL